MNDRQKINISIIPTGETLMEYTYYDLMDKNSIVHSLPGYTYDYPQFFGVPVMLSSIARKVETQIFDSYLLIGEKKLKVEYTLKENFDQYNELIIPKQFPGYWDEAVLIIQMVVKNKVIKDGLYFGFTKAIGNGGSKPLQIELHVKAHFAALTRFFYARSTAHNTFTGGFIGKKFEFQKGSDKDIHVVESKNWVLHPSEEVDVHIQASRIPVLPFIWREVFWGTIFLLVFSSVIYNFIKTFLLPMFKHLQHLLINIAHYLNNVFS